MKKTKIDWADSTWNPVTGCLHGCEYCYAEKIATRFTGFEGGSEKGNGEWNTIQYEKGGKRLGVLNGQQYRIDKNGNEIKAPYPFGFKPTFHRYKLDEPAKWTKPRNIFVCSMADLFWEWVPDEWIEEVFTACEAAPQHRYLFLTKNPGRFCDLHRKGILKEDKRYWYGASWDHSLREQKMPGRPATFSLDGKTVHDAGDYYYPEYPVQNRFVSFEPLLYDIGKRIGSTGAQWHIIGAETGNRKGKVSAKREWVEHIVEYSDKEGIPVFMKESLRELMGADFRQEFPWEKTP